MLLAQVVDTSQAVAATRSRKEKVALLSAALGAAASSEVTIAVAYLSGSLTQRRTGLGWRGLSELPAPAELPTLTLSDVDAALEALSALQGPGSAARRAAAVASLFAAATADEQAWLRGAITGNVRQGALDSLAVEAIAAASGVELALVRRAAMLSGSTGTTAELAFTGGAPAVGGVVLEVGRPVQPMLAGSAPDVAAAMVKAGGDEVAVDAKLDGIRIQVHREGDDVLIATRSLDDITARLPEVVDLVRALPATRLVLDGEALQLGSDGRPRPFQETASRTASQDGAYVTPFFFDLLHVDGEDLLDAPAHVRHERLTDLVPPANLVRRLVTSDAGAASEFATDVVASGHEGVVVKNLDSSYAAGRRGSAWVKVKPVHTLDLVVLAVEHGSGRRRGWLSNIHLGARVPEGGFAMLGKTFKGMTDEMLAWQTQRFRELEVSDDGWVVNVRPEQVVEVAFDGVQRSSRYPSGMALRFARVLRYRDDKTAAEADTVDHVRSLMP